MAGLEKIINDIEDEAKSAAEAITNAANEEAAEVIEKAKIKGEEESLLISKQSEADVSDYLSRAKSAAALQLKQAVLNTKQELINDVIEKALQSLYQLPDEEYFNLVLKMIGKYTLQQKGTIMFSAKDLNRLPASFQKKMEEVLAGKTELAISKETAQIKGGFVLVYGGVEENCSFEALFDAARETMQDKVHEMLF
jgi:V/A-type H+-transporting ATPase subunit E